VRNAPFQIEEVIDGEIFPANQMAELLEGYLGYMDAK
jgi:hypothetical protein